MTSSPRDENNNNNSWSFLIASTELKYSHSTVIFGSIDIFNSEYLHWCRHVNGMPVTTGMLYVVVFL